MSKLRVGIIGCGNVALNFHVPAYQALPDTYEIVGLADPTPERLALGQQVTGLPEEFLHSNASELLNREDIDLVDVCTPQHLHKEVILEAFAAGKHVVSEKPLATIPSDAAEMVTAAEAADRRLGVMHNYLHFPEVIALKEIVESGTLGTIRTVQLDMLGVIDSAGAAGYQPLWRKDPAASGGGVLMDMLHGVYVAEYLLAEPFDAVSARIDATPGDTVESIAWCRMHAGHATALVNIGWGVGRGGISVEGTDGRAFAHYRADGTMPWFPFEYLEVTTEEGTRRVDLPQGKELADLIADSMRDLLADFARAVVEHGELQSSGTHAHHILEAVVAAYGSSALEKTVRLPLNTDSPLFARGVVGIPQLDLPLDADIHQLDVFGLSRVEVLP